jgi:hypothetical protein
MPAWEKWKKVEPRRLACYVHPERIAACFWTSERDGRTLSAAGGADRAALAAAVYDHLSTFDLAYDRTPIDFADHREGEQLVRDAWQVRTEGGSCLDLALVYAGLCQQVGLRPIVVVLRDHTLVAVPLRTGIEEVRAARGRPVPDEEEILHQGLVVAPEAGAKAQLLARADPHDGYLLVECTGVASTDRFDGPPRQLTFAEAVTAGHRQLLRGDLHYLVDVTYLHLHAVFRPYEVAVPAQRPAADDASLGRIGTECLQDMLADLGVVRRAPRWTVPALRQLRDEVAASGAASGALVTDAVDDLLLALHTIDFVRHYMPHSLTRDGLRRALRQAQGAHDQHHDELTGLADHVEHLALEHTAGPRRLPRALVTFVLRLAADAGLDLAAPEIHRWAATIDAVIDVNELAAELLRRQENGRARLIISLHASVAGDWPESVVGWCLIDDEPSEPREHPCQAGRAGLEHAIRDLVDWADDAVDDAGLHLQRVEVAVPTGLLLRWRPEDADISARLVVQYDVVTRWGDRLRTGTRNARRRLRDMAGADRQSCIDWLDPAQTAELSEVEAHLRDGVWARAIGLGFHPDRQESLVRMLLEHSPILLWPESGTDVSDALRDALYACWPDVPEALTHAYRARWSHGAQHPLATLRAVWDDESWLTFCRIYASSRAR